MLKMGRILIIFLGVRGRPPALAGVMARYEHLPIYKKAMDVAVYFEKVVAGFRQSWPVGSHGSDLPKFL
ncbi:hypothetical protein NB231_11804 [Nitrococcus mobilis Nb-231]|uniref:Uncharacterized protein n=2 Tax=Nitrococcus mobilis TaxID=35797 RepID=A4BPB8_9GAMM|nr:hypothetical protein NB231_11804 [Nitrococcus mobilis Nb-231]